MIPVASSRFRFSNNIFLEAPGIIRVSCPSRMGPSRKAHRIARDHFPRNTAFVSSRWFGSQADFGLRTEVLLKNWPQQIQRLLLTFSSYENHAVILGNSSCDPANCARVS